MNRNMELKDYRATPDEGLFEKIERRLRVRRTLRLCAVVAGVALVAAAVVWLLPTRSPLPEQEARIASAGVTTVAAPENPEAQTNAPAAQKAEQHRARALSAAHTPVPVAEPLPAHVQQVTPPGREQPALPPVAIQAEERPVADLILETTETDKNDNLTAQPAKNQPQEPATPHYDNLLWAPNIILPAADNADKRIFKVQSTTPVTHFQMVIYNRGGRQVFSTNDINHAWDATLDGRTLPQGTYVWVARFRDSDGALRQEKGTVTVVR